MAVNGSGIRDTARVLKISPTTVIEELKKTSTVAAGEQKAISTT
jgi:transposase-like protein